LTGGRVFAGDDDRGPLMLVPARTVEP